MWNDENVMFQVEGEELSDAGYVSDDDGEVTQEVGEEEVYYKNIFVDVDYEWDMLPGCTYDEEDYAEHLWSRLMLRSVENVIPRRFMRQSVPIYIVNWRTEITPMAVTLFGENLLCTEHPYWEIVPYTVTGETEQLISWFRSTDFDGFFIPPLYALRRSVRYTAGG